MVQCRFCESDATCEMDIAFQDNSVEHCRALCLARQLSTDGCIAFWESL
jgi:hypothetical protein